MKRQTVSIISTVVIVAAIGGLGWWASRPGPVTGETNAITADDQVAGSAQAKVVVVEYSDFECPACGTYEPMVQQLRQRYGQQVAIVYRHFPLTQIHRYAQITAQAAEAAGRQNKFWEYHDLLFARQSSWSGSINIEPVLKQYATDLGLDVAVWETDLKSQTVKDAIAEDVQRGNISHISGTPTFFLNQQKMVQPQRLQDFTDQIDHALAS